MAHLLGDLPFPRILIRAATEPINCLLHASESQSGRCLLFEIVALIAVSVQFKLAEPISSSNSRKLEFGQQEPPREKLGCG